MPNWKSYNSAEKVRARQVTDKDGETVVTSQGPVIVPKGDYVIDTGDGIRVEGKDLFESRFKSGPKRTASKRTASKRTASKRTDSAADRVRGQSSAGDKS